MRDEDRDGKVRLVTAEDEGHPDGFWPGEKDEQSRAYATRAAGDYLWQVDVDEFYRPDDMRRILGLLAADPSIQAVTFPTVTFWGAPDCVADGWFLRARRRCVPPPLPLGRRVHVRGAPAADRAGRGRPGHEDARVARRRGDCSPRRRDAALLAAVPLPGGREGRVLLELGGRRWLVSRRWCTSLAGGVISDLAASLPRPQRLSLSELVSSATTGGTRPRRSGCSPTSPRAASASKGGGWTTPIGCCARRPMGSAAACSSSRARRTWPPAVFAAPAAGLSRDGLWGEVDRASPLVHGVATPGCAAAPRTGRPAGSPGLGGQPRRAVA